MDFLDYIKQQNKDINEVYNTYCKKYNELEFEMMISMLIDMFASEHDMKAPTLAENITGAVTSVNAMFGAYEWN